MDNIYIVFTLVDKKPQPCVLCLQDIEYEDYENTRDMKNTRTMVINRDHPKFKGVNDDELYGSKYAISTYFDDCPITLEEEEMLIDAEIDIHPHLMCKVSELIDLTIGKEYIKFNKSEKAKIINALSIIRNYTDKCQDEEACFELDDVVDMKTLLDKSKFMRVPFKK